MELYLRIAPIMVGAMLGVLADRMVAAAVAEITAAVLRAH
jgi:hypothetical protein